MTVKASVSTIIAYARSGALDHAWQLFREAGYDRIEVDPAILALHGRLLKDSSRAASGEARRALYAQAAEAYAKAGMRGGGTYPLINAATLSLLAGAPDKAQSLAREILARGDGDAAETPYYRAATRAEAQLLLGDRSAAQASLSQAIAAAPKAFEDHATTLRQFALILEAQGGGTAWLDAFRPPRVLHFAGHMALAPDGGGIGQDIRRLLDDERIGFAFGALAAGADIVIAEALLARGAELNLVLPAPLEAFRAASVARFGDGWTERFDRIVPQARAIAVCDADDGAPSPLAIRLAAEIAMGSAAMLAETLATDAVQVLVVDAQATTANETAALWAHGGRRQHVLTAPRTRPSEPSSPGDGVLAAMLRIEPASSDALDAIAAALPGGTQSGPRWTGEAVLVSYASPLAAAQAALTLAPAMAGGRIAGHYAPVTLRRDPFGGASFPAGAATRLVPQIAHTMPPGAIFLSADFAAALQASLPPGALRTEFVGELPGLDAESPVRLYALKR